MYSQQKLLSVQEGAIILDSRSPKRDSQSLTILCIESLVRVVRVSTSDTAPVDSRHARRAMVELDD